MKTRGSFLSPYLERKGRVRRRGTLIHLGVDTLRAEEGESGATTNPVHTHTKQQQKAVTGRASEAGMHAHGKEGAQLGANAEPFSSGREGKKEMP